MFTGLLRIVLSGYSSSKYSLGLIRGAIVYVEGKRQGMTLYGGTALRSLLEELANPNITGKIDFIEMMRYEVEAKITGNPLIALELPMYFGDLVTLIPGYQSAESSTVPVKITPKKVKKGFSITKKIHRRKKKVKVKFISNSELVDKYSEFLSNYYEHLIRNTRPMGLLTATTIIDLIELLSKYGKQKHVMLARITTSDNTINCMTLMIADRIAGIYCDNMGITVYNKRAIEFLIRQKTGYTVELRQLVLNDICREAKKKILYALDDIKGYYTGLLELNNTVKIKYNILISNKRIIRIGGSIYSENTKGNINRAVALHILPYILLMDKNELTPIKREHVKEPWIKIDENTWKYAVSMAKLLIEERFL